MRLVPVLLLLIATFAVPAVAGPVVHSVRTGVHADKTRLVIELSEPADPDVFLLANPPRLVVDIADARMPEADDRKAGRGLIRALRVGRIALDRVRLVADLARPVEFRKLLLPPDNGRHHRLVIDLRPGTGAQADVRAALDRLTRARTPPLPLDRAAIMAVRVRDKRVVVIDPGHGGVDPGAIGRGGAYEKAITLAFARQLRDLLKKDGRYEVALTRDRDIFVPLRKRVALARTWNADLFISIHADSIENRKVRGGGVYTLSDTASDKEAAALAARENRSDVLAGVELDNVDEDVAFILIDFAQNQTLNHSVRFAKLVIPELHGEMRLRKRAHRFAGFRVLKAPDVPSVLVELGYLSNKTDERLLNSPRDRRRLAGALVRAIGHYFATFDRQG